MTNILKSIVKNRFLIRYYIKNIFLYSTFFLYIFDDYKHLFYSRKDRTRHVLIANITREYHRIEKGLAHKDFRYGFGQRALLELLRLLGKYFNTNFDNDNVRINTALSVLHQYIVAHKGVDVDVTNILYMLEKYNFYENKINSDTDFGGVKKFTSSNILKSCNSTFPDLSRSRHSVRFFKESEVLVDDIIYAIQIAQNSPSVCNRQGWKVRLVKSKEKIELFRKVHNGFSSERQFLDCFLLVTFRKDFFSYPTERNQGYTDAGLFSMSLLYALTHKGFATCPLNANLTRVNEKLIRESLRIKTNEALVMFIAVGHYDEHFTSPKSHRDNPDDVVDILL